jgi:hypothetical protein
VDGRWGVEVWGYGHRYNKREHEGTVVHLAERDGQVEMSVLMELKPDPWVVGGVARYDIRFRREGRQLVGEHSGTFNRQPVKGRVYGVVLDPAPQAPGIKPRTWDQAGLSEAEAAAIVAKALQSGEHNMPAYSNHAAPHIAAAGLLALKVFGKPGDYPPPFEPRFHEVPADEGGKDLKVEAVPLAFVDRAQQAAAKAAAEESAQQAEEDAADGSAPARDKATQPKKKPSPAPPPAISPEAFLVAGPFALGKLEKRRIPGPWGNESDEDPLAEIGGCAKARPAAGTAVSWGDIKLSFEKAVPGRDIVNGRLDLGQRLNKRTDAVCYAFTWVKLDRPGIFKMGWMRVPSLWLAGRRLHMGDCISLPAGVYPLLLEVRGWGAVLGVFVNPQMELVTRTEAEGLAEANAAARRAYAIRREAWEKSGRLDPDARRALMLAVRGTTRFFNAAVGSAGFVQEGDAYTNVALRNGAEFAHAYRQTTGSEHFRHMTNAKWLPFIEVARSVWRDPSRGAGIATHKDKWLNDQEAYMLAGGYGPYTTFPVNDASFPILAGLVDRQYLPAMLWQADRRGLKVLPEYLGENQDVKAGLPEEVMPRVIVDRQKGGYIFRNRYQDADDIVFMAYAKREELNSCWTLPDAGGFRIVGLGTRWVMHSGRWKWRWLREDENCVLVPEAPRGWYGATPTYFRGEDEGSGALSLNMDRTYRKTEPYGASYPFTNPTSWEDAGVRAVRCFAVDYSGRCGAPALFVVADRITGSKGPLTWQMYAQTGPTYKSTQDVGGKQPDGGPVKEIRIDADGRAFTFLDAKGASLRGTIVSPAGKVEMGKSRPVYYDQRKMDELEHHRRVQLVSPSGEFLVILTLQKGEGPAVKVEGEGLAAKVTVGKRTIRFDGGKVALE